MNFTHRFSIVFITFTACFFAIVGRSAQIGKKIWAPGVFAWRNPFKPQPIIEEQANCPVSLIKARFYSFMSIGSSIGSVLRLDVKNISNKPIHSFTISYHSSDRLDSGAIGIHPQSFLHPRQSQTIGVSTRVNDPVTFSVDFVQFGDGDIWFANPPGGTVKPKGLQAGARAALNYLRQVLDLNGSAAVLDVLPNIYFQVGIPDSSTHEAFGFHGFYHGVTNTVVQVEHAYQKSGLSGVKKFLSLKH